MKYPRKPKPTALPPGTEVVCHVFGLDLFVNGRQRGGVEFEVRKDTSQGSIGILDRVWIRHHFSAVRLEDLIPQIVGCLAQEYVGARKIELRVSWWEDEEVAAVRRQLNRKLAFVCRENRRLRVAPTGRTLCTEFIP